MNSQSQEANLVTIRKEIKSEDLERPPSQLDLQVGCATQEGHRQIDQLSQTEVEVGSCEVPQTSAPPSTPHQKAEGTNGERRYRMLAVSAIRTQIRNAIEGALLLVFSLVGGLVICAFYERRVPPVVFGPMAFSESTSNTSPPPTAMYQLSNPVFAAFFPNGRATLDAGQRGTLQILAVGLRGCPNLHLYVTGSASSSRYPHDPDDAMNRTLAIKRAEYVARLLHDHNSDLAPKVIRIERLKRRYNDMRNENAVPATELLNRRADVYIDEGDCAPPEIASPRQTATALSQWG